MYICIKIIWTSRQNYHVGKQKYSKENEKKEYQLACGVVIVVAVHEFVPEGGLVPRSSGSQPKKRLRFDATTCALY